MSRNRNDLIRWTRCDYFLNVRYPNHIISCGYCERGSSIVIDGYRISSTITTIGNLNPFLSFEVHVNKNALDDN